MKIKIPNITPPQWDAKFMQGMIDRMAVSFHKYGDVADSKQDLEANVERRIAKYRLTGNTEWLIDAANFCMIEFMRPTEEEAHFRPTDSHESPGVHRVGERDASSRKNTEI